MPVRPQTVANNEECRVLDVFMLLISWKSKRECAPSATTLTGVNYFSQSLNAIAL